VKKKVLIAALTTCACAFALFPALPVVDFGAIAELVSEVGWLAKQYSEIVDTYTQITNEYNQMVTSAKWIVDKARWKATLTPWKLPTATNTYGTTGGWITAVDTGAGSPGGYSAAVTPLNDYSSVWGSIEATQQDQIGRNYATVELSDGATVNALDQLGTIRANSAAVEEAIDTLETDSLADDPDLNTEVGVLNKMDAAGIIAVRNSQDTNKLLASLLDHQMVAAKAQRDAQAQSINNDIALRQIAPVVDADHLTGATAVLTSYRLP
jgi:hypothetical protein